MDSDDMWMVAFTAPWCGHCKNLLPHWEKASGELKGKVHLGQVDATANQGLASQYGVQGYPTIKWFAAGAKSRGAEQAYEGARESNGIVQFALQELAKSGWKPDVKEMVSQQGFDAACKDNTLCILGFLPAIFDDGKAGREENIALLQDVVAGATGASFGTGWISGGSQPQLEDALGVSQNYPALVLINHKKGFASIFNGAWEKKKLSGFVAMLGQGKSARRAKVAKWPALEKAEPWDGEDYVVEEEEFDLAELMGDDL